MEALYIKLYEKYSKLKASKDGQLDQINQEQEVKFVEFVSAAETLIEHLKNENKRLSENADELRNEVIELRSTKDKQFNDFQERLMEEKQKNQQLSAEVEQLRNLQQERLCSSNRSDRPEDQHVNSIPRSPSVSRGQFNDTSMRMTRKRARLFAETDPATTPSVSHVQQSSETVLSTDRTKRDVSTLDASRPECCRDNTVNGGPCKCLFQGLVECLIGMKVSIFEQPEGRCLRAVHQSSGYSFSLTWVNTSASHEGEFLYHVSSLGTFANVAPEWMREVIIFSTSMCPIFFERILRIIKHH